VGVVLWEALAGERLFRGEDAAATIDAIHNREAPRLSERDLRVSAAVDDVLARALSKDIEGRFDTAMSMARALESALAPASDREIADWVETVAGDTLLERAEQVAAFEGDETGGSKARLYASKSPESGTTGRRDALVPPPLDSVTNEHTTLRGRAGSMPTLQIEAAAALAALPPPGAMDRETGRHAASDRPSDRFGELRAMRTPLVMITPAEASSDAPESGVTRVGPIERHPRFRTPIPMPFSIPPPRGRQRGGRSMLQLAALVIAPPLIVVLGILGMRSAADSPAPQRTVAAAAEVLPSPAPASVAADGIAPVPVVAPIAASASPAAAATPPVARPRGPRPSHRAPPRIARPIPVAVNR
jgi:serine/threonine-protein kinase